MVKRTFVAAALASGALLVPSGPAAQADQPTLSVSCVTLYVWFDTSQRPPAGARGSIDSEHCPLPPPEATQ